MSKRTGGSVPSTPECKRVCTSSYSASPEYPFYPDTPSPVRETHGDQCYRHAITLIEGAELLHDLLFSDYKERMMETAWTIRGVDRQLSSMRDALNFVELVSRKLALKDEEDKDTEDEEDEDTKELTTE
ncbi:hypothetical protein D9758_012918 [Tetrapyrgos nigripes]|uniref:Uncharacterized protein n=1 Tax=Tetrapyrgos nigripes TaxID=182062 RepID=A0A8H5CLM1_9AGAR|nr:hypothetical protein D9758_012918 [Tetrapyrgos nigripes]